MPDYRKIEGQARTWATGHLILAGLICLAVGIMIGAVVG